MGLIKSSYNSFATKNLRVSWMICMLQFPLFIISTIIPKKQLTIYGSMNGFRIADNSKYHYLNNPTTSKYFILKDKNYVKKAEISGFNSVYCYSPKGIWLQLIADKVFWSHGMKDFIPFLIAGSNVIGLQHGAPIKKGGKARELHSLKNFTGKIKTLKFIIRNFLYLIAPYTNNQHCNITICGEEKFNENVKEVFAYNRPIILNEMLPRIAHAPKRKQENTILYAPTYRSYRGLDITLQKINFDRFKINALLDKHDYTLVFRPHPMDADTTFIQNIMGDNKSRIILDQTEDLYDQITRYKLIITDFSSIYQDAIWLGIPVILASDDLEIYHQKFGLFDWFYNEVKRVNSQDIHESLEHFFLRGSP